MKKQILFKSSLFLFGIVMMFGVQTTPVQAAFCTLSSASISPTSGGGATPVTVSWGSMGCVTVEVERDGETIATESYFNGGPGIPAEPSSGSIQTLSSQAPQIFTVKAYGNFCSLEDEEAYAGSTYGTSLCDSQSMTFSAASAIVTVDTAVCAAPVKTWSSSTGNTSSPFTINPPAGGQTVTITPGSLSEGYVWGSVSPSSSQTVYPGESIGFSLPCERVNIQPTLSASPNPYQCGGNTTLSWTQVYPNATHCAANWTSSTAVSGSQVVTPTNNPQEYSITCYGPNSSSGFKSISVPMIANSCSGATVDISANPSSVSSGGNSTISWTGTNVSSCSPGWGWTSSTAASGSQLVSNIVSTTNYPISCISSVGGTNPSGSATVTVLPPETPPVITISASPTSGTVNVVNPLVTWSASGSPTSCTASGDWSGAKASSGSAYQGTLTSVKTYTYTLACSNAYGTGTGSATVVVSAPVVNGACGPTQANPTHWNCSAGTSANNAGTGPWTWNCVGSGGGSTASCSESVGGFTYSLSNGGSIDINRGSPQTNTVTRTAGTGTQGPVSISATVLPPDLSIQGFTYQSCTPTCVSTITFFASNDASLGAHTVTVAGSPASSNGPTSFTVNVLAGTSPVVSCSPSSSSALVGQPVTWSANVSGGTPPYTYVWSGTSIPDAPAPTHSTSNTTDTYSNTYTTTGLKHATVRVTDSVSNFGDCTNGGYPGSDVQINFNPTFQEF